MPAAAGFVYVATYGVNVPFGDDWAIADRVVKDADSGLSFSDYFAQHNEHRILFPRLVMVSLARATRFDTVAEMYVTEGLLLATAAVLLVAFRRTIPPRALLLFPAVVFLLFSFRQWEMMLLGINMSVAMSEAFAVLALLLLLPFAKRWVGVAGFVGALAAATVASFSMLHGLFIWPAGVVVLALTKPRVPRMPAWCAVGACEWLLYFRGYRPVASHPSPAYVFEHPVRTSEYFLTLLGASLSDDRWIAFAIGIFLLVAAAIAVLATVRSDSAEAARYWLAVLAFSLLVLATITAGRAGFGVAQATASRYAPYSLLFVIATLLLSARRAFSDRSQASVALTVAVAALIASTAIDTVDEGRSTGAAWRSARKIDAFYLAAYRTAPDASFHELYPQVPSAVRRLAPALERLRYSVFAGGDSGRPPPRMTALAADGKLSTCAVESIGGTPLANPTARTASLSLPARRPLLEVHGWCLDSGLGRPSGGVYVLLDGKSYPVYYGTSRPDVADHFRIAAYRQTGFVGIVDMQRLRSGRHSLAMVAVSSDRKRAYRPNPTITLNVR